MKARSGELPTVGLAFVTLHALSLFAWIMATAIARHNTSVTIRPPEYHGIFGWLSWDGGYYRVIAQSGYQLAHPDAIRFFPLYPMLGRLLAWPLGGNNDLALIALANVSLVFAGFGIYRLCVDASLTPRVASRAVWFWMLFPGSFVLTWAYSEAFFVAIATWSILALRRRQWWLGALLALLAGLTRPIGVALAGAALIEVFRNRQRAPIGVVLSKVAAVVAAPTGALLFCGYASLRGFGFFEPVRIQDQLRKTESPLQWLWDIRSTLSGHHAFTTGLHIPFVVGFLVLFGYALWRLPGSFSAFAGLILLAALSAQNLNSVERYAMSAFPLAIAGAVAIDRHDRIEPAVFASLGALSLGLCTLALTGAYVP